MFKKMEFMFNKMNMRLLDFFISNPTGKFFEREISRKTGISVGSINSMTKKFLSYNLIKMEEKGRLNFYQANMNNSLVKQFKVIFNIFEIYELLERIRPFSKMAIMYGSCSTGTDTEDSDIDIFILSEEKERIKNDISKLRKNIKRKISPIIMNVNEYNSLKKEDKIFYDNINRGIILFDSYGL